MEPAGLALGAIGLLGLFNLYQEAASVVHSVKNHSSETLRLFSRYNATKVLFERWGKQVGVADKDSFAQSVHPRLKDPATVNAVAGLLASISNVFTDVDPTVARYEQSSTSAAANPGRTKLRSRLKWALADSDKLKQNTEDFDDLVEKLYRLVPPEKLYPDEFQKLQASLIQSQRNQALHQVSHWLDATTTENTFDAYYSTRLDTTCNWIDTHPAYQGWLSGNADKMLHVLWMHGPGGFGKSVLCAYVVKSLQDSGTLPVYSFFCSGNSDAQRNPSAIPRSWVHQAVHQDDDILDLVLGYLNKCNNTKATHSDVLHLLRNIISHNPNLIFVVDGLDECPRTNTARTELHRNRCDILREIMNEGSGVGARLLVVSREEGDIKSQLRPHGPLLPGIKFDELAISKGNVSADVARFAEHVVTQKLAGNQHQLCQELSAQMAQKSDGMFLLIRLQSQNLRPRKGKNQLRRAVDEMPTDIVQVYKRHWDDIQRLPPSDKQRAEAILRWVVFARQPLTILQLSEVVTVFDTSDNDEPQFDDLPDEFDEEFVDDEILGLCGSFLELRAPTPDEEVGQKTVHLIHFSASEFLLGQHSGAPFAETMLQEYHLAQDCLRYLDCSGTWEPEPNENSGPVHDRPFSFYAIFHWFQHVSACAHSSYDVKSRLLPFFSPANPNWAEWRWRYEFRDFDDSEDEDSEGVGSEETESEGESNTNKSQQEVSSPENDYSEEEHIRERVSEECDTEEEVSEEETEDGDSGCADSETSEIPGGRTYYAALFGLDDVLEYLRKNDIFDKDESGGDYGNPLQAAAFRGQIGALKVLLDNGANPEAEGRFGSALHAAVAGNQEEAVAILVRHKVSLQAVNSAGRTSLACSAQMGNYTITQQLLDNNSDVSVTDTDGLTPLMIASFYGRLEIVTLLVEKGALITAKGADQQTALHWAAFRSHVHIAGFLLDNGADLTLRDLEGSTPLITASKAGSPEVVKLLLDRGADISVIDDDGGTPLISAVMYGHQEVLKLLLEYGADPEVSGDKYGWYALTWAASGSHFEIFQSLLDSGADPYSQTTNGKSALSVAAASGQVNVVKALLDLGADTALSDSDGWTPLHMASSRGHVEIVEALLDSGANTEIGTLSGWTSLAVAAFYGHVKVITALQKAGANLDGAILSGLTPLVAAATRGNVEVVKVLLDLGANPDASDPNGRIPVDVAAWYGHYEVVKALLGSGARPGATGSAGWAAILTAASAGHTRVCKLLLDSGADILASATTRQTKTTSIHISAEQGHVDIVKLLLEAGVNVDLPASDGSTPLHYAFQHNCLDVIEVLLHNHASLTHQDLFGCTPFQYMHKSTVALFSEQFDDSTFPTEDARQKRIRKTIDTLSGTPVPFENKDPILLDDLGRCLLRCRDLAAAAKVFGEALQLDGESGKVGHGDIICDECQDDIFGERWVCISCRFVNLCAPCMVKGPDDAERDFCIGHEYHCISTSGWDASLQTDVYTEEFVSWLKELRVQYGVAAL